MGDYRLYPAAKQDVIDIYAFGFEAFGEYQAEAYHEGLKRSLGLLGDFPFMGLETPKLRAGLRRWRYGAHLIFYSVDDAGLVMVRRIIDGRRKITADLF